MRIKNISEVNDLNYEDGLLDIILDVEIDEEVASRWELSDPKVWAVYRKYPDMELDYVELVDQGMNVHGFEFTDAEREEILSFIESKFKNQGNHQLH